MVTADGQNRNGKGRADYYGLSTDTKPNNSTVANGSSFIEMDSGSIYFYDEESQAWIKFER